MEKNSDKKIFGLNRNVISMGVVSFFNDLSSDMIFPFIPIFLTSVLGASVSFVGLVEGFADATASILKVFAGGFSDKFKKRKPFIIAGYSLSALAKPLLAFAYYPWHVFFMRFLDRVGKGTRDAPRDALLSLSVSRSEVGKAFGFHRSADTLGATLGPLLAFLILPIIDNDLRKLFLLSFIASFFAILVIVFFIKDRDEKLEDKKTLKFELRGLGNPFYIFVSVSVLFSLGRASEALLLLRAQEIGVVLAFLPLLYLVYNLSLVIFAVPAGILADRLGHRNVFMFGMLIFSLSYILFASTVSSFYIWFIFALYGFYSALTEGVGRAIVADLVVEEKRGTAYGVYNALNGIALLPGSLIFGILWDYYGAHFSFYYGATLSLTAFVVFLVMRIILIEKTPQPV